jgi:hypothetical protein
VKKKQKWERFATPRHVLFEEVARLTDRPYTEVWLEPGRGPVNRPKLRVDRGLWDRLRQLARPTYYLEEDRSVLPVCEAARLAEGLKVALPKMAEWPEEEKEVVSQVLRLLYLHDGIIITKR